MSFRKKILYYGLMLLLTLLALEGMARIAYYAAYGPGYGNGNTDNLTPPPPPLVAEETATPRWILHPFYGVVRNRPQHALNEMPPARRRADTVVVALLGGSVAEQLQPFLEAELERWFFANRRPLRPAGLNLALSGAKQPQQTLLVANILLLGGEFDLIVNLDGVNEVSGGTGRSFARGLFPFFPTRWSNRVGLTNAEVLLTGNIQALRREQARRAAAGATSPLRRSALFGLANRYRQESTERRIIQRNHELAAAEAAYTLEKYGPRSWLQDEGESLPAAARFWQRSSAMLARLAALAGAEYYHFLQPSQYLPGAKPLSAEELKLAYAPRSARKPLLEKGYPQLREWGRDLQRQGINYFDLTGIFAAHPETLYRDTCCHLNDRGYELLAAAMVRRMEPALRRLSRESPAAPVSALAAARRPTQPDTLLVASYFQVYLQDNKRLRYVRENCAAMDGELRFFLHLTPRNLADLPPHRREHGYDNLDFSFAEVGGHLWPEQCQALLRLPDYPIAYLRTGQYVPGAGELWFGEFSFPE